MKIQVTTIITTEIDYGPYLPTWKIDPINAALNDVLASLNQGFNTSENPTPFHGKVTARRITTEEDKEIFNELNLSSADRKQIQSPLNKEVTIYDDSKFIERPSAIKDGNFVITKELTQE